MYNGTNRILVVGNFGYANHDLSGQTVKTRVVYEMLLANASKVDFFDTQTLCKKINIFKLFNKVIKCDRLVYLPAHGNLKYLFPIYYILSYIFRFEIIYCVIGGWLVNYLKNKPIHRAMLGKIRIILAETRKMRNDLVVEYDFRNVDVMDNFRITAFQPEIHEEEQLKLVFMARIDPKKGLDTIYNLCEFINCNPVNVSITFFGPITPQAKVEFEHYINSYDFVEYKGELEPDEIHEVLNNYDVMLLPTHYYTEGLPGTVIDAYLSGLPVIVSEWLHSREFVTDGISGYIVPFDSNQPIFNQKIMKLYNDRNLLCRLKQGAIQRGQQFKSETAWNIISKYK